jgi:hypothetical protein
VSSCGKWAAYYHNYLSDLTQWNSAKKSVFWYSKHYDCHLLVSKYFDLTIDVLKRDILSNNDLITLLKREQLKLSHSKNVDPHLLSFIKSTLNLPSNNIVSLLIKEG